METTTLLTELLKQGPLIALMGIGLYLFYKKDETRRANDLIEREAMRLKIDSQELRIENYFKNDSSILQDLVRKNTDTAEKQTAMMSKTNEVMSCIIHEIKDFKKSAIYRHHEQNKISES